MLEDARFSSTLTPELRSNAADTGSSTGVRLEAADTMSEFGVVRSALAPHEAKHTAIEIEMIKRHIYTHFSMITVDLSNESG